MSQNHPFGRIECSSEEFRKSINYDNSINVAKEMGISEPQNSINRLVQEVPTLLHWLEKNGREYPWRYTREAWKVFIAEVLLRRTDADQVNTIYEEFMEIYSSPQKLSNADEQNLRRLIESLGLINRRSKTLLNSAAKFVEEHDGKVPKKHRSLRNIDGIGNYIAGATLLFGHQEPEPIIDPNIVRSLERAMDVEFPERYRKKGIVMNLMDELTPSKPEIARSFYFALIDRGAML
jgi:A/G-specific adenine glycosylase